ncbi:probable LRR receptor-like serine/threonine-protein kinase At3g47570 [Corylus avellana]|uniref:probable LRR receptor-like serine/threonine-protein kinase At3g47570 n=1 Tax=Corylus avellana TaxID=13451 RepID=UPI00286B2291|nr:probable LRR receptor-like serine/threonine-protein kinase At3g47570 [Corylus avellana]XP_059462702.1 probable LRR receptor-like serine/threonine-protein kinase At3g47570 [Corylus avellana]
MSPTFCFSPLPMKLHSRNLYLDVILLFSITLLCFQHATLAASTQTNETDRLALLKFKEMITNDPFNIVTSWNNSIHFCNWHGITCGRKHQRVTALDLRGYTLSGSISPYIGNLSFLRLVNLSDNFLHGVIPQQVTHLLRLQHLNLSINLLTGEIPSSNFTNCPQLGFLDFQRNNLTGNIPVELGSLKRLVRLDVSSNHLTGGIPPSLGNVSSLQVLHFSYNYFVGNIPDEIGHLHRLVFFGVAVNNLFGTFPYSLCNISILKIIDVGSNRLNGILPANIGLTLSNLLYLYIGDNEFSGTIPVSLSNASQLEFLDLTRNNFVGLVPTDLGNLLNLSLLVVGGNNLGSNSVKDLDFLTSLENCTKLEKLGFFDNNFEGSLPDSIGNLSKQLSDLYIYGNQISGIIPAALENLINLRILGMEENLFTGTIPTYFGKFHKLQGLDLQRNRLSGQIPSSLGNLTQLVDLYLSQNKLEGSIPSSFGNCKSLQFLDISQNNLSGAIPQTSSLSSQLLEIDLSHNSFTGILPKEASNLKNIVVLDVSENNLFGEIPTTIGDCLSLQNLYLQGNSFEGNLPTFMASLKDLHHADLSRNNFSGIIPKDLQKVSVLQYLNLSFNNLVGEVPTKGVFRNASAISVIGNKKLCGGIPELKLQACDVKVKKQGKSPAFKLTAIVVSGVLCFILFSSFLILYRRRKSKKESSSTLPKTNFLLNVSYKELYQTTDGFSPSNLIGSGSFGSVYKGILAQEKMMVAVKVLNLQQKGASKSFMTECNALRNIRHRNLVKILTCCASVDYNGNEFKALVYEFMANANLDKWLHHDRDNESPPRYLNLLQRLNIAIDVASSLHYLHDHCETPIIHCDLKPSNVLLDDDMIAKVSDFGLARILSTTNDDSQNQTSTVGIKGTIGYAAPEYGMGGEASAQGDVYSYGIFLLEMFTGKRPTDKMFKDGFNLHNFVKMASTEKLVQVVDPNLLTREVEDLEVAIEDDYNNDDHDDIEEVEERVFIENISHMNSNVQKCLLSIFKISLACSLSAPNERMKMEDVTKELHRIKNDFLQVGIHE